MSAFQELQEFLNENEIVESIVFGAFGWGEEPQSDNDKWEFGFHEKVLEQPIPFELRGKLLTLEEAKPHMQCWSFYGGYGSPNCYKTIIWTNERVISISEYDGSTCLVGIPRNPQECFPEMFGG